MLILLTPIHPYEFFMKARASKLRGQISNAIAPFIDDGKKPGMLGGAWYGYSLARHLLPGDVEIPGTLH
ncbi:MAG TPA: hypothetical protein VL899_02865, partial [Alphaproteobacteria bacterium]|nr:hypothetical protein [Alphaproteobacteria bacterium]